MIAVLITHITCVCGAVFRVKNIVGDLYMGLDGKYPKWTTLGRSNAFTEIASGKPGRVLIGVNGMDRVWNIEDGRKDLTFHPRDGRANQLFMIERSGGSVRVMADNGECVTYVGRERRFRRLKCVDGMLEQTFVMTNAEGRPVGGKEGGSALDAVIAAVEEAAGNARGIMGPALVDAAAQSAAASQSLTSSLKGCAMLKRLRAAMEEGAAKAAMLRRGADAEAAGAAALNATAENAGSEALSRFMKGSADAAAMKSSSMMEASQAAMLQGAADAAAIRSSRMLEAANAAGQRAAASMIGDKRAIDLMNNYQGMMPSAMAEAGVKNGAANGVSPAMKDLVSSLLTEAGVKNGAANGMMNSPSAMAEAVMKNDAVNGISPAMKDLLMSLLTETAMKNDAANGISPGMKDLLLPLLAEANVKNGAANGISPAVKDLLMSLLKRIVPNCTGDITKCLTNANTGSMADIASAAKEGAAAGTAIGRAIKNEGVEGAIADANNALIDALTKGLNGGGAMDALLGNKTGSPLQKTGAPGTASDVFKALLGQAIEKGNMVAFNALKTMIGQLKNMSGTSPASEAIKGLVGRAILPSNAELFNAFRAILGQTVKSGLLPSSDVQAALDAVGSTVSDRPALAALRSLSLSLFGKEIRKQAGDVLPAVAALDASDALNAAAQSALQAGNTPGAIKALNASNSLAAAAQPALSSNIGQNALSALANSDRLVRSAQQSLAANEPGDAQRLLDTAARSSLAAGTLLSMDKNAGLSRQNAPLTAIDSFGHTYGSLTHKLDALFDSIPLLEKQSLLRSFLNILKTRQIINKKDALVFEPFLRPNPNLFQ